MALSCNSLSPCVSLQDRAEEARVHQLIKDIQATEEEEAFQPLKPVQDFFSAMKKIESLNLKESLFSFAFMEFAQKPNVQWIAFKIAVECVPSSKTSYLHHLILECQETHSKEMALKAANYLDMELHKKNHLIQNLNKSFEEQ